MRIERLELFPLRLALARPFETARGTATERRIAVLRLTDENGVVGLGEVTPLPGADEDSLADLLDALRLVAEPRLLAPVDLPGGSIDERRGAFLRELSGSIAPPALAAIDTALLDLRARELNLPLAEALGAPAGSAVPVNATIACADPDTVAVEARQAVSDGFQTIKLKVGFDDDLVRVQAFRDAAGYGVRLRIDANGAWWSAEAIESVGQLATYGLELVEQPVAADDLAGMHRVREALAVPVVADEGVRNGDDLRRHIEHGACDGVTVKLAQVGGPTAAADLIATAQRANLFGYVSSSLDGSVGLAVGLHIAAAQESIDLACGLATDSLYAQRYANGLPQVIDGSMTIGSAPGLGVEIDDAALVEFADR